MVKEFIPPELLRSHHDLRVALILARRHVRKSNSVRANGPILDFIDAMLRDGRRVARGLGTKGPQPVHKQSA
jgi:hypothetical protein